MVERLIERFFWQDALLHRVFRQIADMGGASVPILPLEYCEQLVTEAKTSGYLFMPELAEQGKPGTKVYQELETVTDFPRDSGSSLLKYTFEVELKEYTHALFPYPFTLTPYFNSVTLARYPKGSIGITPHMDHLKYKNLLCIFVLAGKGKFFLCNDRQGNNAKEIDASVGNIIFLRCPGFRGIEKRPFHFLSNIDETRYSLVLRQEDPSYTAP